MNMIELRVYWERDSLGNGIIQGARKFRIMEYGDIPRIIEQCRSEAESEGYGRRLIRYETLEVTKSVIL